MGRTPKGATRQKVYSFMRQRLLAGQPPTVREVQQALGFKAVQTARSHLEALVRDGLLGKAPGLARGYSLGRGERVLPTQMVPLLGRVQAGALTTALEEPEGFVPVASTRPREGLFALRVRGESMRDAGILDGDIVVVRQQPTADPGDIVVALVGDEATVKRLRMGSGAIELWPDNPAFEPIRVPPGELQLLGKVIELRRLLEPGRDLVEAAR
ncbi:MAG: transcriptional repressor LexA [Pseudomonadota bacterium]